MRFPFSIIYPLVFHALVVVVFAISLFFFIIASGIFLIFIPIIPIILSAVSIWMIYSGKRHGFVTSVTAFYIIVILLVGVFYTVFALGGAANVTYLALMVCSVLCLATVAFACMYARESLAYFGIQAPQPAQMVQAGPSPSLPPQPSTVVNSSSGAQTSANTGGGFSTSSGFGASAGAAAGAATVGAATSVAINSLQLSDEKKTAGPVGQKPVVKILKMNGGVYRGEVSKTASGEYVPHGCGSFDTPEFTFWGEWRDNQRDGAGYEVTKTSFLEGTWIEGKKDGWFHYQVDKHHEVGMYENDVRVGVWHSMEEGIDRWDDMYWVGGRRVSEGEYLSDMESKARAASSDSGNVLSSLGIEVAEDDSESAPSVSTNDNVLAGIIPGMQFAPVDGDDTDNGDEDEEFAFESANKFICPNCGEDYSTQPDAEFCPSCGHNLKR